MAPIKTHASIFLCLLALTTFPVLADTAGRIAFFAGDVEIVAKSTGKAMDPVLGRDVGESDTISTGSTGRIKLIMDDDSELNVLGNSNLEIAQYKTDGGKRTVLLILTSGKVRAIVHPAYDNVENHFNIKTPSALLGVHGTDFVAEYQASSRTTKITTLTGAVQVASLSKNGEPAGQVEVKQGQMAQLKPAQRTVTAKDVDRAKLAGLDVDTKMDPAKPDDHAPKKEQQTAKRRHHRSQVAQ